MDLFQKLNEPIMLDREALLCNIPELILEQGRG